MQLKKKVLVTGGSGFIGIHLISELISKKYSVLNIDIKQPLDHNNIESWVCGNILNKNHFSKIFNDFAPDFVVHLAAVTTQNSTDLNEFEVNIEGTKHIIDCCKLSRKAIRLILTSSQYINTPGNELNADSSNIIPYGYYGLSKKISEDLLINSDLNFEWTIIRPGIIWGPYHSGLEMGLWRHIHKGIYVHPFNDEVVKSYGYVRNTAQQILSIMELKSNIVNRKTYYLGDGNLKQKDWVNEFSKQLKGKNTKRVSKYVLFMLSLFGELYIKIFRLNFPLFLNRYRNLVTSNPLPLEETFKDIGHPQISLCDGMTETVIWFKSKQQ